MKEELLSNEELQLFKRRDLLIKSALALPFTAIAWRLWDLQIKQGAEYKELAKGNRIRLRSVAAPRGIIYDTQGVILSKNIASFNLMLVREDTDDIKAVLRRLSDTLKIPLSKMKHSLASKRRVAKYAPILIHKELTWYQMALVSAYEEEFPGISIEVSPRRYYPQTKTCSHVIGYMTQINKAQLKKLPSNKIMSAQIVGQDGMERIYNEVLIGSDGGQQVEVDSTGRMIRQLKSIDPTPGVDIKLNLDSRLQKKIETLMGDYTGAAILTDPYTGAIKAMVSLPAYDPNLFSLGLSSEQWKQMSNDPDHILNNKCIQGLYSPGSTFKMAVAAAALEEGVIDAHTEHVCEGRYRVGKTTVHCWKRSGHGPLDVSGAIENSCNIFFYKVGMEMGVDKIHEYASKFGFGRETGVDLLHEKSGLLPNKAWKRRRFNEIWYPGETLPVSIGQGYLSVTPLQLVSYINIIANGGMEVRPHLASQIFRDDKTETLEQFRQPTGFKPETLELLRNAMFRNVHGAHGTGKRAKSSLYLSAGKTGTTQVVSHKTRARMQAEDGKINKRYLNHAWYAGYAPYKEPKISGVLLLENGKAGTYAAGLMKQIMEFYLTEIEPLPSLTAQPDDPQV